ncbi:MULTISPECIES: flavin prenyltransferase UbiX [unclassified Paenibacillus]|uniref:UbiX family flavin prenyltransferase n=1 Tax=unclassified Paenibacillus TaxID=185978 RepID=UPI002406F395|nr:MULTISPECIES: flavin prenyltransferase UbiX [unclassified Paenibacillus]MDF9844292.1 4-hydroxy-3-polyprenylbenzoate decarboxylase [Paenibacillus sp. PastF-2]MDF9850919.1 4-hydroxy-3-polyprenylbenzoate decarboxylase [Paenibacillus sp. PastM-2]MDF9857467.1 4-hydroxy-3-polyprenylbenzoate decarboxylase [Paenibacillus sp. PastF-1]MDH6482757.1 4-hydroxy-3-polyprenylbenzoate decarboxylase [Paenibacillus sp. PastH-2]MDH6510183.1 4-hydroxy-3-polyprenylbenzoate decarboxylase [Paenibacillus sp. PastM-
MRIVVAITGASGSIYGYSLIRSLHQLGVETYIIATGAGENVLGYECGIKLQELEQYGTVLSNTDLFAPVASGSFKTDGMVIIPCSMNTLGAIANGMGDTLLNRAASVVLKERRRLVIVPRETPLHLIHLENMLRLARAGADIVPASPGFYNHPTEIWELVNFMNARVLDAFGIEHQLMKRWGEG